MEWIRHSSFGKQKLLTEKVFDRELTLLVFIFTKKILSD